VEGIFLKYKVFSLLFLLIAVKINKQGSPTPENYGIQYIPIFRMSMRAIKNFIMKYNVSLKEFVSNGKRNYNQLFHYTNTRSYHGRWEFSRLFC